MAMPESTVTAMQAERTRREAELADRQRQIGR
jgi:hypothetical protein